MSQINQELWVGLVLWIFLVLAGLRFREYYILAFASLMGLIVAVIILTQGWTLVGLGLFGVNLYRMYDSLSNW